jgi:hypothetical protein
MCLPNLYISTFFWVYGCCRVVINVSKISIHYSWVNSRLVFSKLTPSICFVFVSLWYRFCIRACDFSMPNIYNIIVCIDHFRSTTRYKSKSLRVLTCIIIVQTLHLLRKNYVPHLHFIVFPFHYIQSLRKFVSILHLSFFNVVLMCGM